MKLWDGVYSGLWEVWEGVVGCGSAPLVSKMLLLLFPKQELGFTPGNWCAGGRRELSQGQTNHWPCTVVSREIHHPECALLRPSLGKTLPWPRQSDQPWPWGALSEPAPRNPYQGFVCLKLKSSPMRAGT